MMNRWRASPAGSGMSCWVVIWAGLLPVSLPWPGAWSRCCLKTPSWEFEATPMVNPPAIWAYLIAFNKPQQQELMVVKKTYTLRTTLVCNVCIGSQPAWNMFLKSTAQRNNIRTSGTHCPKLFKPFQTYLPLSETCAFRLAKDQRI